MTDHPAVHPDVTVFMAVRNEERHLRDAVESVFHNGYPGRVTMVVAVGPSEDATSAILDDLAAAYSVEVVDNPHGGTPQGLTHALSRCTTEFVIRMDGHAVLPRGYLVQAVEALLATDAANVGGRMVPEGTTPFQRAVAEAMKSRWGIGGAGHRIGGQAGPVDSVYLGAFRKSALDDVGGYDPHFARAQDWELNARLRAAGHTVWFVPAMAVAYRPRATWRALARQFHESGRWRREVSARHPGSTSWRYLAPPVVTIAIVVGTMLGLVSVLTPWWWLALGWAAPAAYLLGVLTVSVTMLRTVGLASGLRLPLVLITMHLAWGMGFLRGLR